MFGLGIVVALGALLSALAVTSLLVRSPRSGATPMTVAREWRLVQGTRLAGVLGGLAAAALVAPLGSYGVGAMLAPAVFGLCLLLAVALGETVVRPRAPQGHRSASLTPRRVRDYLPQVTSALVALMLLLTAATLLLTTLTASRDPGTGTMRALSCSSATVGGSHTPYPGSYYSVPLTVMVLVVLLVAALAAGQVVRRPRGMASTAHGDDALRRRSLVVIVAATGIAVCAPLAGLALVGGGALRSLGEQRPSCAPGWMAPAGSSLMVVAVMAVVVALVCLVQLAQGPLERTSSRVEAGSTS